MLVQARSYYVLASLVTNVTLRQWTYIGHNRLLHCFIPSIHYSRACVFFPLHHWLGETAPRWEYFRGDNKIAYPRFCLWYTHAMTPLVTFLVTIELATGQLYYSSIINNPCTSDVWNLTYSHTGKDRQAHYQVDQQVLTSQ